MGPKGWNFSIFENFWPFFAHSPWTKLAKNWKFQNPSCQILVNVMLNILAGGILEFSIFGWFSPWEMSKKWSKIEKNSNIYIYLLSHISLTLIFAPPLLERKIKGRRNLGIRNEVFKNIDIALNRIIYLFSLSDIVPLSTNYSNNNFYIGNSALTSKLGSIKKNFPKGGHFQLADTFFCTNGVR